MLLYFHSTLENQLVYTYKYIYIYIIKRFSVYSMFIWTTEIFLIMTFYVLYSHVIWYHTKFWMLPLSNIRSNLLTMLCNCAVCNSYRGECLSIYDIFSFQSSDKCNLVESCRFQLCWLSASKLFTDLWKRHSMKPLCRRNTRIVYCKAEHIMCVWYHTQIYEPPWAFVSEAAQKSQFNHWTYKEWDPALRKQHEAPMG